MKKFIYLLIFGFLFFIPIISQAYVIKSTDFIYIAKDEIIEGNLYFSGKSINIEGQVLGDVIGIAPNIQINGQIAGDLISVSQNLIINGQIDGNLRTISSVSNISGSVGKNVNFLGETIILGKDSFVGQDLLIKTISLELNGKIGGNVHGGVYNSLINGQIEKNVNLVADNIKRKKYSSSLAFGDSASVSGNLEYKSGNLAKFQEGAIKGKINHKTPEKQKQSTNKLNKILYLIFSSFLVALILDRLFKNKIEKIKKIIIEKKQNLILPGLIILIMGPIIFFLIAITIIALPVAIIGLMFWFLFVFLSRIIVSILLGDYIFKLIKKEKVSNYLKILSGVSVAFLFFSLPLVGWFFSLLSIMVGLGSLYFIIKNK